MKLLKCTASRVFSFLFERVAGPIIENISNCLNHYDEKIIRMLMKTLN